MRNLSVLVIEDNPDDIEFARYALTHMDDTYDLMIIRNGKDAIDYLETLGTHLPHLILLNLSLPIIPGYKVKEYIEAQPHLSKIPLVIISGFDKPKGVDTGQFVQKMHDLGEFKARLQRAISEQYAKMRV